MAKDGSVDEMLTLEDSMGLYRKETFSAFADKINGLKEKTRKFLAQAKSDGKSIAGFGASITGTTLIYHFEIGSYWITWSTTTSRNRGDSVRGCICRCCPRRL